jgi:Bacterial alpha-L-rhamnosidase C-terminal domain
VVGKKSRAKPVLGAYFENANVRRVTPFGVVGYSWEIVKVDSNSDDQTFNITVIVPPGTTMEVVFPLGDASEVKTLSSGKHSFSVPYYKTYQWPPKLIPWNPNMELEDN